MQRARAAVGILILHRPMLGSSFLHIAVSLVLGHGRGRPGGYARRKSTWRGSRDFETHVHCQEGGTHHQASSKASGQDFTALLRARAILFSPGTQAKYA